MQFLNEFWEILNWKTFFIRKGLLQADSVDRLDINQESN